MVHFHIHTDGRADVENDAGRQVRVPRIIVNLVWIGLGFLLWVTAFFLIVESIRGIERTIG